MPIERELAIPGARPGSPAARAVATYLAVGAQQPAVVGRLRAVAPFVAHPGGEVAWHAFDFRQLAELREQYKQDDLEELFFTLVASP